LVSELNDNLVRQGTGFIGTVLFSQSQSGVVASSMIPLLNTGLKIITVTNISVFNISEYPQYAASFTIRKYKDGFMLLSNTDTDVISTFSGKLCDVVFTVS
jgi:hypothetical protein